MSDLYGAKHGRLIVAELDWAKCGTESNYRAHLRRGETPCEACRLASRRAAYDRRARYRQQPLPADDPRHGTLAGYNVRGCRCQPCTAAMSHSARQRRAHRSEVSP